MFAEVFLEILVLREDAPKMLLSWNKERTTICWLGYSFMIITYQPLVENGLVRIE